MALEKESSPVVVAAPCVPPPPPPMPPMLNITVKNDGRTQLFAEICKAASLKKASAINDSTVSTSKVNLDGEKNSHLLHSTELTYA